VIVNVCETSSRVDPRDHGGERMLETGADSPHAGLARREAGRSVVDRDRPHASPRPRVHSTDRPIVEAGDPECAGAADERARPGADGHLADDPVRTRVDDPERIRVHRCGRRPTSSEEVERAGGGESDKPRDRREATQPRPRRRFGGARRWARTLATILGELGIGLRPRKRRGRASRDTPWLQFERCVLDEDRLLESLQRLTRLDPQLVHEHAPRPLVCVQGLRLPAGPVEREHQLSAKALAQGIVSDQRFELGDEVVVATERKVGLDPLLECRQVKLLQPGDLDVRERVECELRKRRAAPEGQGLAERCGGGVRVSGRKCASSLVEQGLEPMQVELAVGDRQDVAMGTGQEDPVLTWIYPRGIVLEPSPQFRDEA